MTPVMRFAIRTDGQLVLGRMMGDSEFFKPGHVYEVREVMGEPTIVDLGVSAVGASRAESASPACCWGNDASLVVNYGHHLFTAEEFVGLQK